MAEPVNGIGSEREPGAGYMSVREAAEYLGISPHTLYKLLERREVPAGKLGGAWRLSKARLDEFINSRPLAESPSALVVERDEAERARTAGMMSRRSRSVLTAPGLDEAERLALSGSPDVMFVAAEFGVAEISAFVRRLRTAGCGSRMVLMAGPGDAEALAGLLAEGPVHALRRPVEREDVIAILALMTNTPAI
jgi:excisionase family DNA binding protein